MIEVRWEIQVQIGTDWSTVSSSKRETDETDETARITFGKVFKMLYGIAICA